MNSVQWPAMGITPPGMPAPPMVCFMVANMISHMGNNIRTTRSKVKPLAPIMLTMFFLTRWNESTTQPNIADKLTF